MDDRTRPDADDAVGFGALDATGPIDGVDDPDAFVAALLSDPDVWSAPPAGLEDSLVAAIAAEAGRAPITGVPTTPDAISFEPASSEPASPQPLPAPSPTSEPMPPTAEVPPPAPGGDVVDLSARRRRRWGVGALAAAAAAVVVIGGAVVVSNRDDDTRTFDTAIALGGTDLAPEAEGVAEVTTTPLGLRIILDVRDLPPAEPGTFYQAWVRNETGGVSAGTFHLRGGGGEIELWSGVPIEDYPIITVTLQTEGEGPASSGMVVLRGELSAD